MSDYPIIFSAPMVRALLDGRKTMTRRIPTPTWRKVVAGDRLYVRESHWRWGFWAHEFDAVKERWAWSFKASSGADSILFDCPPEWQRRARAADVAGWWFRPAIHHPRSLSRLTLVVTATKIEKLQAISEEDAVAEGIAQEIGGLWRAYEGATGTTARAAFAMLWNHLHGNDAWSANPAVVALTFTVHKVNIDRMAARPHPGHGRMSERMNISRAYMAIAMLAKHDGVSDIKGTQPDGVWRRDLGDWKIALNANGEPRPANDGETEIPPFTALLECKGWPCGLIDPAGGVIAGLGGASEDKLMADIEAEIGATIEAALEAEPA